MPKRLSLIIFVLASFLTSCIPTQRRRQQYRYFAGPSGLERGGYGLERRLNIRSEVYAEGLERPTAITHANDGSGRVFVVQQSGKIAVLENAQMTSSAFLDISDKVSFGWRTGLTESGLSPKFQGQ